MAVDFLYREKGICYLTEKTTSFSKMYCEVRLKENRILTDIEVKKLPYILSSNLNANEWELRQKTSERFIKFLNTKPNNLHILDIGCGNGWFSNLMAINNNKVRGLDINSLELEQAARVFNKKNLDFWYGDLFKCHVHFKNKFDIITLNASVQYFPNLNQLISQLKLFLKSTGEIHILDSPFYTKKELLKAVERTEKYYKTLGLPEMAEYYFHHTMEVVQGFEIIYAPKKSIITTIFVKKDSPFIWLRKKC